MNLVGIDVGFSGGIAIYSLGKKIRVYPMPVIKRKEQGKQKNWLDETEIENILSNLKREEKLYVLLEEQRRYKGQDNSVLMAQYGFWQGYFPNNYLLISPKEWQKFYGFVKGNTKQQSAEWAQKLYPYIKFKTEKGKLLDGLSDAALILNYGKKLLSSIKDII